jgi:hypothetical protein
MIRDFIKFELRIRVLFLSSVASTIDTIDTLECSVAGWNCFLQIWIIAVPDAQHSKT